VKEGKVEIRKLLYNKKGADKVMSVYWFAILVIIAGGIFAMVYNFYSSPYDVRNIESDVLSNKVADCVSFQGRLNDELFNSTGFDKKNFGDNFYEICNLNFKTESDYEWDKTIQYFVEIDIYNIKGNEVFSLMEGNEGLKGDCFIKDKKGNGYEKLSKCSEKRFYSVGPSGNDNQYLVEVLTSVKKSEKNVKV
jgi:hypothetical protein